MSDIPPLAGPDPVLSTYLVERVMPALDLPQLVMLGQALTAAARLIADGQVRYLRGMYVPSQSRCICVFLAPDATVVNQVVAAAQLPCDQAAEVVDMGPLAE
jgi:uncharacterized protein DUF4242